MGEQIVAAMVTGVVIIGICAVIYQLNTASGVSGSKAGAGVASDLTSTTNNIVTSLFKG
jgi:hypothetical protein